MDVIERSLEQKSTQMRAVGQITVALAAAWKLEDTLDAITRITSPVLSVDSCSIYLQEEGGKRLVLKATTGLSPGTIGRASLNISEDLTGWAVTHGQPMAIRDALINNTTPMENAYEKNIQPPYSCTSPTRMLTSR